MTGRLFARGLGIIHIPMSVCVSFIMIVKFWYSKVSRYSLMMLIFVGKMCVS